MTTAQALHGKTRDGYEHLVAEEATPATNSGHDVAVCGRGEQWKQR
jgi:hypothetical protein